MSGSVSTYILGLQDIVNELPSTQDATSAQIETILLSGSVVTLHNCSNYVLHRWFGPGHQDIPRLRQHEFWKEQISLEDMRDILIADSFAGQGNTISAPYFFPSSGSNEKDRLKAANLLVNIDKPFKKGIGSVLNLPSPTLERLCRVPQKVEELAKDHLRMTEIEVNVTPCGGLVDLHHDESNVLSTLFSGVKIWFMYPPTAANLKVLRKAYYRTAETGVIPERIFENYHRLEGGVTFVQPAGSTVWVPPFCPHAVFTTQTSVLPGFEVCLASKFPQRLSNLPLYMAWYSTMGAEQKKEKIAYANQLMSDMARILKGEFDKIMVLQWPIKHDGPLRRTVEAWDASKHDWKILVEGNSRIIAETKTMWKNLLSRACDNHCLICGFKVNTNDGMKGYGPRFDDHFETEHWGLLHRKRKRSHD